MARLTFPSGEDRLAYGVSAGGLLTAKPGTKVRIYSDAAATTLADIQTVAGAAIANSELTVDSGSQVPLFKGPDGVSTLYVKAVGGSAISTISAKESDVFTQYVSGNLQQAIGDAVDGATLIIRGDHSTASQISWSGKRLTLLCTGARLIQTGALSVPLLLATNASGSIIDGLTVVGSETLASFDGLESDRAGIRFDTSDEVTVSNVKVTGKSVGIELRTCTRSRVVSPKVTGFTTSHVTGVNYHAGVRIHGGSANTVTDANARNIGSVVLMQSAPDRITVTGGHGENCWDNGVYVSSGNRCKVIGFTAEVGGSTGGSGVKVRGSHHIIEGCSVRGFNVGYSVTGNTATLDAYGANGYGNVVQGNIAEDCTQDGLACGAQDGFYQRHLSVIGNTFRNVATSGGGFAAIRGTANHSKFTDNIIENADGTTAAVILSGVSADPWVDYLVNMDISRNHITDSASDGFRLTRVRASTLEGNTGQTLSTGDLLDLRSVQTSLVSNNRARGIAAVVRGDATTTDNKIFGNDGDNGATRSVIIPAVNWLDHLDTGSPETTVTAAVGSRWIRRDGGAVTTLYIKETGTGTTGWVAK